MGMPEDLPFFPARAVLHLHPPLSSTRDGPDARCLGRRRGEVLSRIHTALLAPLLCGIGSEFTISAQPAPLLCGIGSEFTISAQPAPLLFGIGSEFTISAQPAPLLF